MEYQIGTIVPFIIAMSAIMTITFWRIYVKAGQPGWAILIPIYNIIVWLKIINKPWWWIFLLCIPLVNIIFGIMMINLLAKSFGRTAGFTVGLIFLGAFFYPLLAFKDYEYVNEKEKEVSTEELENKREYFIMAAIILLGIGAFISFIFSFIHFWYQHTILVIINGLFAIYVPIFFIGISTSKKNRTLSIVLVMVILYLLAFSTIFPAMRQFLESSGGYY